jgi:hypothetical protein
VRGDQTSKSLIRGREHDTDRNPKPVWVSFRIADYTSGTQKKHPMSGFNDSAYSQHLRTGFLDLPIYG